jgi:hypothetical protein
MMVFCISGGRLLPMLLALLLSALPLAAHGDTGQRAAPTYAHDADTVEVVHGTITSFDGRYALQVRDDRGYFDTVQLVQGTIIHPTGLRLQPGMRVQVRGTNRGFALFATQIDTPGPPSRTAASATPSPSSEYRRRLAEAARDEQKRSVERLEQYRAAKAAYDRAQEAKARTAAQRLAEKLEHLYGHGHVHVAASPRAVPTPRFTPPRPAPAAKPTRHPVAVHEHEHERGLPHKVADTRMPARPAATVRPIVPQHSVTTMNAMDHEITRNTPEPQWFGWGKL